MSPETERALEKARAETPQQPTPRPGQKDGEYVVDINVVFHGPRGIRTIKETSLFLDEATARQLCDHIVTLIEAAKHH